MKNMILAVLLSLFSAHPAQAEISSDIDLSNLTLEDLLSTQKTSVASQKSTTAKGAPGIVTVITAEEIGKMGARDLVDLLGMVPGFNFSGEIYTSDGLSVRGIYANEGRALLLIDGITINENLYGNFPLYGRFPIDQIEKIEVIRGAGSAIYGGFAALAVINITTKGAGDKDTCLVSANTSSMSGVFSHQGAGGLCRKTLGPVALDYAVNTQQSNRSARGFSNYDTAGPTESPIDLKHDNRTRDLYMNLGVAAYGFKLRGLLDTYTVPSRSIYGTESLTHAYDVNYWTHSALASYTFNVAGHLHITPSYAYKVDSPWQMKDKDLLSVDPGAYFDVSNIRQTARLNVSYDVSPKTNLLVGVQYMQDHAHTAEPCVPFKTGTVDLAYHSNAVYAQVLADNDWVNIAAGARYEDHTAFDPSFVPRLALTKEFGRWHVKGLWSQAYRNPSISNINSFDTANYTLRPEKTNDIELEGGLQFNSRSLLTLNLFDERITDPIIYVSATDTYITAPHLGTQGFELEHRTKTGWGSSRVSYSFYRTSQNDVTTYKVDRKSDALLGNPQHKIAGTLTYRLSEHNHLTPSAQLLGPNFTNSYDANSGGIYTEQQINPVLLLNLNWTTENIFKVKGLHASVGVFNILDQHHKFVIAYRSEHEDIPGPSRDLAVRLGYDHTF